MADAVFGKGSLAEAPSIRCTACQYSFGKFSTAFLKGNFVFVTEDIRIRHKIGKKVGSLRHAMHGACTHQNKGAQASQKVS
jgi:hypothetical protein